MHRYNLKTYCQIAVISATILWCASSSATLLNEDFASGFDHWQGVVIDIDTNTASTVDPSSSGFASNYQILGGGTAQLSTTSIFNPPNDIWSVALFQNFVIPNLSVAGNSLQLSLNLGWSLSDPFMDAAFAQLVDLDNLLPTLDIAGGGIFDITAWAGRNVSLQFQVDDGDDIDDWLRIGNIAITESVAAVPEPATWLLISAGFLAMGRKIFRHLA